MYTKLVIDTKDMLLNKPSFELSSKKKKKMEKDVEKEKAKRHTYK